MSTMKTNRPSIVVFATLFPSAVQPLAGIFIRERMFRVARTLPVTVVSPAPWFPFQSLIRWWRPDFRPRVPRREVQDGIEVLRPRFLSVPGLFKRCDGIFLALGSLLTLWRLKREGRLDILDSHFAYPEGYAAALAGRWLGMPVTITLRGTEPRHIRTVALRPRVRKALDAAARVFAVSQSLKDVAIAAGVASSKILVVGNGVDTERFAPIPQREARATLGLPADARILISVGGLVERKGFHRVMDCLPGLRKQVPGLHYLIVGGPSAEGDWGKRLHKQAMELGLTNCVHFLGKVPPEQLNVPLSAADVFVLASSNEGWANVLLEAMACGLPVVTTDVGGNREVVSLPEVGLIIPFGDRDTLFKALAEALVRSWDRQAILDFARSNLWDSRIAVLVQEFERVACLGGRNVNAGGQPRHV